YYDPLEFWVEEAHKRGLELHVWLNPYRTHHSNGGAVTSQSMVHRASDYVVRLKNGMYWFDPADQRTQDHAAAVVYVFVKRYDIDGVHLDDYFYPYSSYNGEADFPYNKTWNPYRNAGVIHTRVEGGRQQLNIFFDDYFYPSASYTGRADFPDNKTWNAYGNAGGTLTRADWRRHNVNKFIERVYKEIKAENNFIKFGLSPFGIWKPGYPAGITGS